MDKSTKRLFKSKVISAVVAIVITFIAFYPTLNNGWVNWDDDAYVLQNNLLTTLDLGGIIAIFKEPNVVGNYHPLTVLSLAADHAISGKEAFTYHLHNLLLHVLNVLLVFLFIFKLFKNNQVAFIVAILFGIHPMHVESVAWISARKDVLYTAYLMLGLISYLVYSESEPTLKRRSWYLVSFILFSCSLLSKGVAMVFPAYLFLIDYLKHRKVSANYLLNKLPFIALSGVFVYISFYSQQLEGAFISEVALLVIDRFAIASTSFLVYLFKAVIPTNLSPFHPFPFQDLADFPMHFYFSLLLFPSLIGFVWIAYRKKWKIALFGVLFFTVTLIPLVQLIPLGRAMMAERYTYVAYLGIFVLLAFTMDHFIKNSKTNRVFAIGVFGVIVILFSSISYSYAKNWKNGNTLWTKVIEQYPDDYFGYYTRAEYFLKRKNLDRAFNDVNKSVSLYSHYGLAYHLRGKLYENSNKLQLATSDYKQAILLSPNFNPPYVNLARILGLSNQPEAALNYLNEAISINPTYATALLNRGVIHEKLGEPLKARADYSNAIKIEPKNGVYYRYRGVNYLANQEINAALADFSAAVEYLPKDGLSYFLRAKTLQQKGLYKEAFQSAVKALELNYPVQQSFIEELNLSIN